MTAFKSLGAHGSARAFAPTRRVGLAGIGAVAGFHVLVGYALVSGLARDAVQAVQRPLLASIVPAPPPPPPKTERVVETSRPSRPPASPPTRDAAPPARVPTPAVAAAPSSVPAPPVAEPAPAPTPAEPAREQAPPPERTPVPASGGKAEAGVACPGYSQSLQASLAGAYDRVGIAGVVKVQFRVRGGTVTEVATVSGPREYYRAVQAAVRRFQCQSQGADDALVVLDIDFRPG